MSEPTKKQIKEFWGGCGLTHKRVNGFDYWYNSLGLLESITTPPIDPNNLFKYAVPKVIIYLMGNKTLDRISAIKYLFHLWLKEYIESELKSFDLALFWAIYKLIGSEKENERRTINIKASNT